jgi:protein-disulfide isomerase
VSNERQQRAARAEQMRKEREKADRKQRNLITVAIVLVVVVLIAVAGYAITKTNNDNKKVDKVINPVNTTKDFGIRYTPADAGGKVPSGTKPVSVELYEDFQCPVCKSFEEQSGAFLEQQVKSGAITITYRPFSFLDENGGSPNRYSHRSTSAALCALDAGGIKDYVKVHDYLYANQPEERTNGPENADLIKAFDGLGITGLDSCIKTERYVPWVDEAKAAGAKRGVNATPTVYVGGKKVEAPTPENLQKAITAAAKG